MTHKKTIPPTRNKTSETREAAGNSALQRIRSVPALSREKVLLHTAMCTSQNSTVAAWAARWCTNAQ